MTRTPPPSEPSPSEAPLAEHVDADHSALDRIRLAKSTPFIIFAMLALAIAPIGRFAFERYQAETRLAVQKELLTLTDSKIEHITTWLNERQRDADSLVGDQAFGSEFSEWLSTGAGPGVTQRRFLERLHALRLAFGYEDILIYDSTQKVILTTNAAAPPPIPYGMTLIREVLVSGQRMHTDIRHLQQNGQAQMRVGILAPIFDARPAAKTETRKPIGVVVLRNDPSKTILPSITRWPSPTKTGETFLAKVEEGHIVYLTSLRFPANTTTAQSFPINHESLLAAKTARGQEGLMEGTDYRGAAVIGASERIPGTSWLIVSKIDQDEVYAPIRRAGWIAGLVTFLFVAGAGIATTLWWRNHRNRLLATLLQARLSNERTERRLSFLSKYANDIMLMTDENGVIIEANDRAAESYGYESAILQGMASQTLIEPAADGTPAMSSAHGNGNVYEAMHRRHDGTLFPVEVSERTIEVAGRTYCQSIIRDISERKQAEEAQRQAEAHITHLAHHDPLTGLLNRYSLHNRLAQALAAARRERHPLALLFLDMDHFKIINDTYGHASGDELLIEVARRLESKVRDSDIVARLGGDEFVVVLGKIENNEAAARVADKILMALGSPYIVSGHTLDSTPSIGVALYPKDGEDGETLMKHADRAMYHAKSMKRNNVQFFNEKIAHCT